MDERMKQLLSVILSPEQIEAANQYCLKNLERYGVSVEENIRECEGLSASEWIISNFPWMYTKEGKPYWQNIYEQLEKIESKGENE